jgi:hypothetical protein
MLYRRHLGGNIYKQQQLGLMFVRLAFKFGQLDRVVLTGEARSGVSEWGKQYRGCWFL